MSIQSKFCIVPFKTALVDRDGIMVPCCEYDIGDRSEATKINNVVKWWNTDMQLLRDDMVAGRENKGCHHCIKKEKNPNVASHRKHINRLYGNQILTTADAIDSIEIRVSNYCNLKCIMCGPYASSSISAECRDYETEYKNIGLMIPYEETTRWWDDADSMHQLKLILANVSNINFAGGEPLLVPEVIALLDSLDPSKIKRISFNTNLTRVSNKFLLAIKRFERVDIGVSLEGHGAHNDYVRFGSDWSIIEKNIKILSNLNNVVLSINHVLQHTSIYSLPNLLTFVNSMKLGIQASEVYVANNDPSQAMLEIHSAPQDAVDKFNNWLSSYNGIHKHVIQHWVDSYSFNQPLYDKFCKYTSMLDKIRGCDFQKTFLL